MKISDLDPPLLAGLLRGLVIPAHPLALDRQGSFDERHQRALTRYYLDAGAGGIAVGVHTTQFAIRKPEVGLLEPVLALASETATSWAERRGQRPFLVAGVCGRTAQAVGEAELAQACGYHATLLSLGALDGEGDDALINHCEAVAKVMPVFGFYLQPAAGGRSLGYSFWRRFAEIDNVIAIKVAPFDRYATADVVRAVCESGRAGEIALYTGNDDNIVGDLLTEFRFDAGGRTVRTRFAGGLLGHWAVWTRSAAGLFQRIKAATDPGDPVPQALLTEGAQVTDANAALFDAANGFAGCIAGIQEILFRQGLLASTRCLDATEQLSPGQADELDRVTRAYPWLDETAFIEEHQDDWLR